ncbi:DinB family protein [Silvibacterium acidisoli]|uniref:DinB family protein n=1 Tax=Acidobacteriaceae bacterium ZG23-2 TaxID=2883246 RepID=UPI00406CD2C2
MEQTFIDLAVTSWSGVTGRLDKFFAGHDEEQLLKQVAPGRNRLFYLLGHLTAIHDRMLPLLFLGERLHPELDECYIANPDRTLPDPLTAAELKQAWTDVNAALLAGITKFSTQDWLARHSAVSEEDFAADPTRNRFTLLLNRTNHASFHLGQAILTRAK